MQVLSIPLLSSYTYIAMLSGFWLAVVLDCASVLKNVFSVSSSWYSLHLFVQHLNYRPSRFTVLHFIYAYFFKHLDLRIFLLKKPCCKFWTCFNTVDLNFLEILYYYTTDLACLKWLSSSSSSFIFCCDHYKYFIGKYSILEKTKGDNRGFNFEERERKGY